MREISGKAAIVTGGASGIGLGIAAALLEEGVRVALIDLSAAHLDEARAMFAGSNAVHFIRSNVAERAMLRDAVAEVLSTFGSIDILCNNAGIGGGGAVDDPDFEAWDRAIAVNLGGVVNGCKLVAPIMRAQGSGGHIVNTSSMAGILALPDDGGAYTTAKFGVRGLTESLRLTLAPHGIGVSCLCPGFTRSRIMTGALDGPALPEGMFSTLTTMMAGAMEPIEIGRAVVRGIRGNLPYILTHAEFRDEVADGMDQLLAAFPVGQQITRERLEFEDGRRRLTEERKAIRID